MMHFQQNWAQSQFARKIWLLNLLLISPVARSFKQLSIPREYSTVPIRQLTNFLTSFHMNLQPPVTQENWNNIMDQWIKRGGIQTEG